MIVLLDGRDVDAVTATVVQLLESSGANPVVGLRDGNPVVVSEGVAAEAMVDRLGAIDGVAAVQDLTGPYQLTSREFQPSDSIVAVGDDVTVGSSAFVVAAGPCAVENPEQLARVADVVAAHGATILRGGAYKPRTSPYSFQGLGGAGLKMLDEQRVRTGMPVVTEVLDTDYLSLVAAHADMLQIGARNMHNYTLLREAGRMGLPVLLKRGLTATVQEWLQAAEYVLCGGADVVLCERGIRTFENSTRFTLDLSAIPVVKRLSHLPVIVDPSHAAGDAELVRPLARAAAAAGADGLLVDVHTEPRQAQCDGRQALDAAGFAALMSEIDPILEAVGRARLSAADTPVAALV